MYVENSKIKIKSVSIKMKKKTCFDNRNNKQYIFIRRTVLLYSNSLLHSNMVIGHKSDHKYTDVHLLNRNSIHNFSCFFFFQFLKNRKNFVFFLELISISMVKLLWFCLAFVVTIDCGRQTGSEENCHIFVPATEVLLVHWIVETCLLTFQVHFAYNIFFLFKKKTSNWKSNHLIWNWYFLDLFYL